MRQGAPLDLSSASMRCARRVICILVAMGLAFDRWSKLFQARLKTLQGLRFNHCAHLGEHPYETAGFAMVQLLSCRAINPRSLGDQICRCRASGGAGPAPRRAAAARFRRRCSLEVGMRAWADNNAMAAHALRQVDRRRRTYIEKLLRELGMPAPLAAVRTTVLYWAYLGAAVSHHRISQI